MTTTAQTGQPAIAQPLVAMVSGNDLLAQFNRQAETLARVETKVDGIPGQVAALQTRVDANHEAIAELKQWRAYAQGIAAVVVLLMTSGVIAAIVTSLHR